MRFDSKIFFDKDREWNNNNEEQAGKMIANNEELYSFFVSLRLKPIEMSLAHAAFYGDIITVFENFTKMEKEELSDAISNLKYNYILYTSYLLGIDYLYSKDTRSQIFINPGVDLENDFYSYSATMNAFAFMDTNTAVGKFAQQLYRYLANGADENFRRPMRMIYANNTKTTNREELLFTLFTENEGYASYINAMTQIIKLLTNKDFCGLYSEYLEKLETRYGPTVSPSAKLLLKAKGKKGKKAEAVIVDE